MIPLTTSPALIPEQATASALPIAVAANIGATSTAAEHARFIHQVLCSPPAAALLRALATSSELVTIPGLTAHLIQHHLQRSTATDKGHMPRHQQGVQSTRSKQTAILQARNKVNHLMPTEEICAAHDMFCFAALADLHTGTMYTDLTGAFPVHSFKNMQYIFVAYIYDLNAILVHALPSKNNAAMIAAFSDIFSILAAHSYAPTLNVMDNECSKAVKVHIKANKMNVHLVPPHNHHVNAAERAIATFKEHFIAGLATVDKNCPLQLWDEFLPQIELTLNLLCFS
jgi:hypothetical protein